MPARTAIVVGGGLAGIAAALELGRQGIDTTLLERRKSLGGRASSFLDPVTGRIVDNGQHVLLGACRHMKSLLAELGTERQVQWHDSFELWCPEPNSAGGIRATLRPSRWIPARARFLPSLLRLPYLTWGERLAAARGMARAAALDEHALDELDTIPFETWLHRERQPPRAISRLWAPVIVSALNESIDRASARAALWVFRRGFLGDAADSALGIPKVTLSELVGDAALTALSKHGVKVELGAEVRQVFFEDGRAAGVRLESGDRRAGATVLATPWDTYSKLLPTEILTADTRLEAVAAVHPSPIVSTHLFFEPDVKVRGGALALVESRAQWIFDRHAATGRDEDRGHWVVVVSAARELSQLPREQIAREMLSDLRAVMPAFADREPIRTLVVTEWNATYSSRPGLESIRPEVRGGCQDLYLASDMSAIGWPPTMEGAVRAGRAAAREIVANGPRLEVGGVAAYPPRAHG